MVCTLMRFDGHESVLSIAGQLVKVLPVFLRGLTFYTANGETGFVLLLIEFTGYFYSYDASIFFR